jgi:hypothetical protein
MMDTVPAMHLVAHATMTHDSRCAAAGDDYPPGSIRIGVVAPNFETLATIFPTCADECVRAFFNMESAH